MQAVDFSTTNTDDNDELPSLGTQVNIPATNTNQGISFSVDDNESVSTLSAVMPAPISPPNTEDDSIPSLSNVKAVNLPENLGTAESITKESTVDAKPLIENLIKKSEDIKTDSVPIPSATDNENDIPTLGNVPANNSSNNYSPLNNIHSQGHNDNIDLASKSLKFISVSGIVKKPNGTPIIEAVLYFKSEKNVPVKAIITDQTGTFNTKLRAPFAYNVEVKHENDMFEQIVLNLMPTDNYNFTVTSLS